MEEKRPKNHTKNEDISQASPKECTMFSFWNQETSGQNRDVRTVVVTNTIGQRVAALTPDVSAFSTFFRLKPLAWHVCNAHSFPLRFRTLHDAVFGPRAAP